MIKAVPTIALLVALLTYAASAKAQGAVGGGGGGTMLPLPTTMSLEKVLAGKRYGDNAKILSIAIDRKTYYYVLRDIYAEDPVGFTMGLDVWRHVQSSRPMMTVRGGDGTAVAELEPGQTVTVQGLFSFGSRSFAISEVVPGLGLSAPPKHY
jgi:hypothetical protein